MQRAVCALLLTLAACGPADDLDSLDAETPREVYGKADTGRYWPVIRQGDSNRNVVTAQYLLRHHGESLSLTGAFSSGMKSAVIGFQKKKGLWPDGVVGGNTWEKLIVPVRLGDLGWAVGAVQDLLLNRYAYGISITKLYGTTTHNRVTAFQKARCLNPDGVVGEDTWYGLVKNASFCTGGSSGGAAGVCYGTFTHPAPGYPVTSEFGTCRDGCTRRHEGIDIGTPTGTPVRAANGGVVVWAGWASGYGYAIDVSHCGSYTTRYAHLSQFKVYQGQTVARGQTIALSGNTGVGTGPHLHFEVRKGGSWGTPINPRYLIQF